EAFHALVLGGGGWFARMAPGIGEESEVPARGYRGVLLAKRAGGGVARVDIALSSGSRGTLLERLKLGIGHVDLAADLDRFRPAVPVELVRDVLDGLEVLGDVLADIAVAARGALDEDTVLVAQRGRETVDLGLD